MNTDFTYKCTRKVIRVALLSERFREVCNGECVHSIARRTENQCKLNADFSEYLR